jgi:hypothetical protein
MAAFREALENRNLFDNGYEGYTFTWDNARDPPANVKCRLDRVVSNAEWREYLSQAK